VIALAITGVSSASYFAFRGITREPFNGQTHTIKYEPLQMTIVERGTLESAENGEIMCQVKAGARGGTIASTIKWVIDDGSEVKKDQAVIDLDDAGLIDQLTDQKIKVDTAAANFISAEQALKIVESQNESDIATADVNITMARLNLDKYVKGDYEVTKSDLLGKIQNATSSWELWQDKAYWSLRMANRNLVNRSQAEADRASLESAKISKSKTEEDLKILENFTKALTETDLDSKLKEAGRAEKRVKAQALAKKVQADADLDAKKKIHEQEKARYADLEEEIRKCHIRAPQDGLVVYYIPESTRFGTSSQQSIVAQGEPVREGQKLMRIPNLKKMQVSVRVHEAMRSQLHDERGNHHLRLIHAGLMKRPDLLQFVSNQYAWPALRSKFRDENYDKYFNGQPALIRTDAFPTRMMKGHVKTVANVPSQADFMSSDVRVYATVVSIDEEIKDQLRPGMSAEVTIFADNVADNVLTVPIQSIVGTISKDATRKIFVVDSANEPHLREVKLGRSNEKMVEVKEGAVAGDKVVINPQPLLVGEYAKLKIAAPSTGKRGGAERPDAEMKGSKGGKGKQK
jgi:HlyD family secretion protein